MPRSDILFTANYLIPNGIVERIRYIVYVDPSQYARLAPASEKVEIARAIGRLNRVLQRRTLHPGGTRPLGQL